MEDGDTQLFLAVDLFERLSREEIEGFAGAIPTKDFDQGHHIYTTSYRGGIFFLLLQGRVRVYRMEGRQEITLSVIQPGGMFGEAAFTDRWRKGAFAQALEPSKVALFSRKTFDRLLDEKPQIGLKAMEILSDRLSLYEARIADISTKNVLPRLASLILDLARSEGVTVHEGYEIPTHYTHEQLGSMIGAKRVAVTRALTRLRKCGVVEVRRRRLYVKDAGSLQRIAE